jgi:hypothetical protein
LRGGGSKWAEFSSPSCTDALWELHFMTWGFHGYQLKSGLNIGITDEIFLVKVLKLEILFSEEMPGKYDVYPQIKICAQQDVD